MKLNLKKKKKKEIKMYSNNNVDTYEERDQRSHQDASNPSRLGYHGQRRNAATSDHLKFYRRRLNVHAGSAGSGQSC